MTRNSVSKNKARIKDLAADSGSFGKTPLQSWIGKIVPFKNQVQQVKTGGWGWRYKVRIMGDHSNNDNIPDKDLDYAYVLLPTTAGSGGGGRIRTPRLVQGDMVYGVYGGGDSTGIRLILGVFPRTDTITYKSGGGKFNPIQGWFGNLKPSPITEQNEVNQANISTPNNKPTVNYSNRELSAGQLAAIGISPLQMNGPAANVYTPPPRTRADKPWNGGNITSAQLNYIRDMGGSPDYTGWKSEASGTIVEELSEENIRWRHVHDAESQAIKQRLIIEEERTKGYY